MTNPQGDLKNLREDILSSDTAPLIEIQDLRKSFIHSEKRIDVLRGIDLCIYPGEVVSIMGMSGVGKSTFLQILGTLDVPSSGKILFDGVDISTLSAHQLSLFRNQKIGFVFQFHHLLPEFSALENVMMPCLIARMPRKEAMKRAEALLHEVGLGHRMENPPSKLSGGEQQRVSLARALVMEPRLVLADEPTGNLDRSTSEDVHKLFMRMNRAKGIAMVLVTHNPSLAAIASRRLQMIDGKILEEPSSSAAYYHTPPGSLSASTAKEPLPEGKVASPPLKEGADEEVRAAPEGDSKEKGEPKAERLTSAPPERDPASLE